MGQELHLRFEVPEDWRVDTPLPLAGDGARRADHLDHLLDSPIEIGTHKVLTPMVGRVRKGGDGRPSDETVVQEVEGLAPGLLRRHLVPGGAQVIEESVPDTGHDTDLEGFGERGEGMSDPSVKERLDEVSGLRGRVIPGAWLAPFTWLRVGGRPFARMLEGATLKILCDLPIPTTTTRPWMRSSSAV